MCPRPQFNKKEAINDIETKSKSEILVNETVSLKRDKYRGLRFESTTKLSRKELSYSRNGSALKTFIGYWKLLARTNKAQTLIKCEYCKFQALTKKE